MSPGSNVAPVMPRWIKPVGAEPSKLHNTSLPSSPFTFTYSHECGLLNVQRTTLPVLTICVSRSNIAKEWCASATVTVTNAATKATGSS